MNSQIISYNKTDHFHDHDRSLFETELTFWWLTLTTHHGNAIMRSLQCPHRSSCDGGDWARSDLTSGDLQTIALLCAGRMQDIIAASLDIRRVV